MDTLTFNSPILLRHLTFSEARKLPIDIIKLDDVLKGLEMDMDHFIDFCLLCGCDYLEPLKKMGPKTALKMIKDHDNVGAVLEYLAEKKNKDGVVANPPPENWPFEEARQLFKKPDVIASKDLDVRVCSFLANLSLRALLLNSSNGNNRTWTVLYSSW